MTSRNAAFAVAAVFAIASNFAAAAEPRNFKQTHYFKLYGSEGDSSAERAGYEAENRAYPSLFVEPSVHRKAASDAEQLERRQPFGDRSPWKLIGLTGGLFNMITKEERALVAALLPEPIEAAASRT